MRSGKYGKAILIGLFTIWVLLAVSNDWVASDNPLVKRPFYTFYFSEQEITGMDRLVTHTTGILESDYVPNRYYEGSAYEPNTTIRGGAEQHDFRPREPGGRAADPGGESTRSRAESRPAGRP
jgi:hypothetical protein